MKYIVVVDQEFGDDIYTDEFSGKIHYNKMDAMDEIVDALCDMTYAGMSFDIREIEE